MIKVLQRFKSVLPFGSAVLALAFLNLGLYTRLAPKPENKPASSALPYTQNFETAPKDWVSFAGDWLPADGTLVQKSASGYDLGITAPVKIPEGKRFEVSSKIKRLAGAMGGGLLFNVQQQISRQKGHMLRFNVADLATRGVIPRDRDFSDLEPRLASKE